jgi:hypothetical protein
MTKPERRTPCLLWPFVAIIKLVDRVRKNDQASTPDPLLTMAICSNFEAVVGISLTVLLGLVLFIAGTILTVTIVGAFIGIPLAMFGIMIMVRGLW